MALLGASAEARADVYGAPPPSASQRYRIEAGFGVEGYSEWFRHAPQLMLQGASAPRDLVGLVIPDAPEHFIGVGGDVRGYGLPFPGSVFTLASLRYARGVGSLPAGTLTADGAPVVVETLSSNLIEIGIPWLNGMAFTDADNRFRAAALLQMGAAYAWGSARLSSSRGTSEQGMHRFTLFIRPELDVCARPFEDVWLCVPLSANVHEFGWMNGGSVGLRVEVR